MVSRRRDNERGAKAALTGWNSRRGSVGRRFEQCRIPQVGTVSHTCFRASRWLECPYWPEMVDRRGACVRHTRGTAPASGQQRVTHMGRYRTCNKPVHQPFQRHSSACSPLRPSPAPGACGKRPAESVTPPLRSSIGPAHREGAGLTAVRHEPPARTLRSPPPPACRGTEPEGRDNPRAATGLWPGPRKSNAQHRMLNSNASLLIRIQLIEEQSCGFEYSGH